MTLLGDPSVLEPAARLSEVLSLEAIPSLDLPPAGLASVVRRRVVLLLASLDLLVFPFSIPRLMSLSCELSGWISRLH